jgi:hypothetical protein
MLTLIIIAIWVGVGALGALLLWHAVKADDLLNDHEEEGEHDVLDRRE